MKRCIFASIVCLVVLSSTLVPAEEQAPTAVPAKAQAILEKLVGTWNVQGDPGEDGAALKGQSTLVWSPGRHYLLVNSQYKIGDIDAYDNGIVGWDGLSEDGIVIFRRAPIGFYETYRFKLVSETVNEGVMNAVGMRGTHKGKIRMVQQGDDKSTWYFTDQTAQGQPLPDWKVVYTRVKSTSDEQELIRLQQEWSRAEVAGDVAAVGRLLADEYVLTLSDGTPVSKAEYLRDVQSEDTRSIAMTDENTKVRLYGNMALANGIVKWTEPSGKKHEEFYSETWLQRDGRWQCLATHTSEIKPSMANAPMPTPEMKKLEVLAGNWVFEGERVEPPFEGLPPAGKYTAQSTNRFVLGGAFLESRLELEGDFGELNWLIMTGYDAQAKEYIDNSFMSIGNVERFVMTISPDGRTFTSTGPMHTETGQRLLARHVTKVSSDGNSSTYRLELSADNGKTWKFWLGDKGKRLRP